MNSFSIFRYLIILIFSVILTSCGGSSGSDIDDDSQNSSPPSLYPTSFTFNAIANGPRPASQSTLVSSFSGDRLTVNSSLPTWLSITNNSSSSTPFHVDFNILTTNLTPGTYSATLRFNNERTIPFTEVLGYQDVNITYVVAETLTVSQSELTFNVVDGTTTTSPVQTINIYGGSLTWTATTSDTWIELSKVSGIAPDSIDVNISAIGSSLSSGTHSGSITLTSTTTSETIIVPVTLNVEPHRLAVFDKAIALTKLPSRSYLSHTIQISDNGAIPTNWTATENSSWLSLGTTSGTTTSELTLTADPNGLADGLYFATITISPDNDPSIANTETVNIGLYISSDDALASDTLSYNAGVNSKSAMHTDPLRPYVYVTNGGPDISVFNIYTKALVNTISITDGQIHDLAINSDGSLMYAANLTDLSIAVINLNTQSISQTFTDTYFSDCGNCNTYANSYKLGIKYDEPNGFPVLITNSLDVIDATTGAFLTTIPGPSSSSPLITATSPVDNYLYAAAVSYAMNEFHRYDLNYSHLPGVGLFFERTHLVEFLGNITDLEVLNNGNKLCASISGSNNLTCYNSSDLSSWLDIAIDGSPRNIEIGNTGNIYASYSTYPDLTVDDISVFDASGASLSASYNSGQYIDADQLAISGDGLRMISRGGDAASSTRTIYFYDVTP